MSFLDVVADTLDPAGAKPTHLCRQCGNRIRPVPGNKINKLLLVLLLCLYIIPGVIYWLWASNQKYATCPRCKARDSAIPLNSPEARWFAAHDALASEPQPETRREERACPWCAEQVLKAARVCKHCGRDIEVTA
jgi:hypothetical protein